MEAIVFLVIAAVLVLGFLLVAGIIGAPSEEKEESLVVTNDLYGLPLKAEKIYSGEGKGAQLFLSSEYGLRGKPDAIYRTSDNRYFVVEYKSQTDRLYDSTKMQIAGYCLLVEEQYGSCAGGIFVGKSQRGELVNFTAQLKNELLAVLKEMGELKEEPDFFPGKWKCRSCEYSTICE